MQQKELLSALIDGEQQEQKIIDELCRDKQLQSSWHSMHLIRTVIRQESSVFLDTDFTAKIEALIADESAIMLEDQPSTDELQKKPLLQKIKPYFSPLWQIGVAAAICLVAVIGVQSFTNEQSATDEAITPVLKTLPFNRSVQEVSYNASPKDIPSKEQIEEQNKRVAEMLESYELQRRLHNPNSEK